jgi:hypothetical protein
MLVRVIQKRDLKVPKSRYLMMGHIPHLNALTKKQLQLKSQLVVAQNLLPIEEGRKGTLNITCRDNTKK